LERITIRQARSYEDQDWESLKQENPKSMKHEKRHRHARLSIQQWMDIHKQTWWRFLVTQEVQTPLGIIQGLSQWKHGWSMCWSCADHALEHAVTIEIW